MARKSTICWSELHMKIIDHSALIISSTSAIKELFWRTFIQSTDVIWPHLKYSNFGGALD